MLTEIGELNKLCKEKQYYWGINKYCWKDHYNVEVSSSNFDDRPSFHEEIVNIDDAIGRMLEFAKCIA